MSPAVAPSWGGLQEQTLADWPAIVSAYDDLTTGPPSPLALLRTFGSTEEPRVKLYRDHAAWCPYCQRVWLMLEEKKIPYKIEKINMRCYGDKPASFLAKVPRGLLPVLELDGRVITESADIMTVLEREFTDVPLMPPQGTPAHKRAQQLMQLERHVFSEWMGWLTTGWMHDINRAKFNRALRIVDDELQSSKGSFFLGEELSMVDLMFVPFVERMVASLAYYKGFHIRGTGMFPGVDAWFEGLEQRPTYLATKSDHYTHCHDLPPQLGGCEMHEDGAAVARQINGQDGKAWRLPLSPLSATSKPEAYSPGENPSEDRARAAYRLVNNHVAVARFAARGAGEEGAVPVWAPLADPSAVPNEDVVAHVDLALTAVAKGLLEGVDAAEAAMLAAAEKAKAEGVAEGVSASLAYLRDRVGVPRDLPLPAARQLRAHLNWSIGHLV